MNWKWNWRDERVVRWNELMEEFEEKYEDEGFFTMVIGEDYVPNLDSSINNWVGYEYGFGVEINDVGSVFK